MQYWQVKIGSGALSVPSAYGIEEIRLEYLNRAADTCTLSGSAALLAAEYGDTVEVWHGNSPSVRVFVGTVRTLPLSGPAGAADREIVAHGPWHYLDQLVYCQRWKIYDPATEALQWVYSSRAVLGQGEDGQPQSVGVAIAAILEFAANRGVQLQLGPDPIAIPIVLPLDEVRDLTCAQAIDRLLRFTPSVCTWWDYSTTPAPTLYFGQAAAVSPAGIVDRRTALRSDLVVPGIRIEVERTGSVDGQPFRSLEFLTAGDPDDLDAAWTSLQLSGLTLNQSRVSIDIATEAIPDPLDNADWWIARHPRLRGIAPADLAFIQATRGDDPADYPRVSLNPLSDLSALTLKGRVETFRASVDIIKRDGDGVILTQEHAVELELQLVTTDAATKTYSYLESADLDTAETLPEGLAAALLAHWSVLYAEGTAAFPVAPSWPRPGNLYASTPIQRVAVAAAASTATIVYGPPQHLSASDLSSLLARFRTRRASSRFRNRLDGEAPAAALRDAGAVAPAKSAGHADGAPTRLRMVQGESSTAKTIDLDPAKLSAGAVAEPRQIDIPSSSTAGKASRVVAISTEASAVDSPLRLLVGTTGAGLTTVTEGEITADLAKALRVVNASGTRLALDISTLYLVDASGNTAPLSYFFGTSGTTIGLKLDHVVSPDEAQTGTIVAALPLREYDGSVYPKGAYLL